MSRRSRFSSAYVTRTSSKAAVVGALILSLAPLASPAFGAGPKVLFLSSNNTRHFAWWDNYTVSQGDSTDHVSRKGPYPFKIGDNRAILDKLFSISSNDEMHFAWRWVEFGDPHKPERYLHVCRGTSDHLCSAGGHSSKIAHKIEVDIPGSFSQTFYEPRRYLRFITSNNRFHFAWYLIDGWGLFVSRGPSDDLGREPAKRVKLPAGVQPEDILYMASNDTMHFAFLRNGTYIAGRSDKLDSERSGVPYDLRRFGNPPMRRPLP